MPAHVTRNFTISNRPMNRIFHLLIILVLSSSTCLSQWFDQQTVDGTVLLEKLQDGKFLAHGTGFVFFNYKDPQYPIVVTCAHLLKNPEIYVTVNADSSLIAKYQNHKIDSLRLAKRTWVLQDGKLRCRVRLTKTPIETFVVHPTLDIGAFLIDLGSAALDDSGRVTQELCKLKMLPASRILHRKEVATGDEAFFVGFPFGLGTESSVNPVIRSGSVAWEDPTTSEFLLDALSFGGNSGSPVFTKGTLSRKPQVIHWEDPMLIGMILGHLGDSLEGILTQPNPALNIVERKSVELQNWGLARCVWVDEILPILDNAQKLSIEE
jgi:hypothetical protein